MAKRDPRRFKSKLAADLRRSGMTKLVRVPAVLAPPCLEFRPHLLGHSHPEFLPAFPLFARPDARPQVFRRRERLVAGALDGAAVAGSGVVISGFPGRATNAVPAR